MSRTTMVCCEPPLLQPVFRANYTLTSGVEHAAELSAHARGRMGPLMGKIGFRYQNPYSFPRLGIGERNTDWSLPG